MFRHFRRLRRVSSFGLLALFLSTGCALRSQTVVPSADWVDDYDPLASEDAVVGGTVKVGGGPYPKSLNYYLDSSVSSAAVFSMMFDSLLSINPVTTEFEPFLAERCEVSEDKLSYTFYIDERARWSDGQPVSAADVVYTFDTVMDPKHLTGPHKVRLESFARPEALGERVVRFTAREPHWRNLLVLATLEILPKHAYADQDFNKINFEFPVTSGRYRLSELREGVFARMERRDDWWLKDAKRVQGTGNFQTIEYRYIAERETAFEAFMKGDIDFKPIHTSHIWVNETKGEAFDKNWVVKQQVYNYNPPSWQGFAINARLDQYADRRVRLALGHLLDRERMNQELMFNQYALHRSFMEDLYGGAHANPNSLIAFDKQRARELLAEAGWSVNPATGKLEKDGEPFVINFLTRSASSDKFLVIYREDLADVGIDLKIVRKDWAAWMKDMDAFSYEMTWAAWGGSIWRDPESSWHSKEADRPSGQNITGFKNAEVDALIEEQKLVLDVARRNGIFRQIDEILFAEVPYVLLWFSDYARIVYWNKFGTPWTVLSKYGDDSSALMYWWVDPDAEAELEQARKEGRSLAPRPFEVRFDEEFDG